MAVRDRGDLVAIDLSLQVQIVRLLVQHALDPLLNNPQGVSAWELAQRNHNPEIRQALEAVVAQSFEPGTTPEAANEPVVAAEEEKGTEGDDCQLWPSSTVHELLSAYGLQEYQELFDSEVSEGGGDDVQGFYYCHDLYSLSEEDFKSMGVKFGHRKRLVELLRNTDCLTQFLEKIELIDRAQQFRNLGFESIWSILGVKEEYREKMELTEEEMQRWLAEKERMVGVKRGADRKAVPPVPVVRNDESSEKVLRLIFSESETKRIMAVGEERVVKGRMVPWIPWMFYSLLT